MSQPRPGVVVVADHQGSGRGRRGRTWEAAPCSSVAISAVLPLSAEPSLWGWVPLLVGHAAADAVQDRTGVRTMLKWPNDLLGDSVGGGTGKLAGVLVQSVPGHPPTLAVAGIGLNLDAQPGEVSSPGATSLARCGASELDREVLIAAILLRVSAAAAAWGSPGADLARLQEGYRQACATLGQRVRIDQLTGTVAGVATGIDDTGRLLVEVDGRAVAFAEGDVVHVRPGDVS